MITRATILTGDADSPVVLHVPQCPPAPATEFTPRMLLDGSLDTAADRIVHHARKQSRRRPHAVLNRLPRYLDDALFDAEQNARPPDVTQLCRHHAAIATESDPYLRLVRSIVDERVTVLGRATLIEIRTTMSPTTTDPVWIGLGVDTDLTPSSLIDAAATAFGRYCTIERSGSTLAGHDDPSTVTGDSPIHVLTITIPLNAAHETSVRHRVGDALAMIVDSEFLTNSQHRSTVDIGRKAPAG